ncbi:unnamed protein product, partial [Gulo gulo]
MRSPDPERAVEAWLAAGGCGASQAADGLRWGGTDRPGGSAPPLAHRLPPLPAGPLLPGRGGGEGEAVGVQEVQQLLRGHADAVLLQLGLQLGQLEGLVQQDLAVEGRPGADVVPQGLLRGCCGRGRLGRAALLFALVLRRLKGRSELTGRRAERDEKHPRPRPGGPLMEGVRVS